MTHIVFMRAENNTQVKQLTARRHIRIHGSMPVSYTHLDVYKRQLYKCAYVCVRAMFPVSKSEHDETVSQV